MARSRSALLGPAARPVAVPENLEEGPKAEGRIELPAHIRWSGPRITYDLADPLDRARVYEQVLREGTEADVRFFVRPEELRRLWNNLVLPQHVRAAWDDWLARHPGPAE